MAETGDRRRDFRTWLLARSISVAGTAATTVALPVLVYASSHSAGLTATVGGLGALPYLVFGLLFGAVADSLGRLTTTHLVLVAFGVGVGFCWFDSAAWGALARLVGRAGLTRANATVWGTTVVIGIVAPALAGVVLAVSRPSVVLAADAL